MPAAPIIQFPRAEIAELIEELTDVPCIWAGEPMPQLGQVNGKPGYWTELSVLATATKGVDENRPEFDPINLVNGISQISYRIYTVQMKVQSFSKDLPAFDVIDQIRRGLRSLTSKARFVQVGIAFVDWGASKELVPDQDTRATSTSALDVRIAWQVVADPGDEDGVWIEKVASFPDKLVP